MASMKANLVFYMKNGILNTLWHEPCYYSKVQTSRIKHDEVVMNTPAIRKKGFAAFFNCAVLGLTVFFLLVFFIAGAEAAGGGPIWKVGRAIVLSEKGPDGKKELELKLSLRNTGRPGNVPVRILGRWKKHPQEPRTEKRSKNKSDGLKGFKELGRFRKEMALKKTSILRIRLKPLKTAPRNTKSIEVVVFTGKRETDRRVISLPAKKRRRR